MQYGAIDTVTSESITVKNVRKGTTYTIYINNDNFEEVDKITTTTEKTITFNDLLPNTEYLIVAKGTGASTQYNFPATRTKEENYGELESTVYTVTVKAPKKDATYSIYMINADGSETKLNKDINTTDTSDIAFEELLPGTEYRVEVKLTKKGQELIETVGNITTKTESYGTVEATLDSVIVKDVKEGVEYFIYNADKAEDEADAFETITAQNGDTEITFDGLFPNTKYIVKAKVSKSGLTLTYELGELTTLRTTTAQWRQASTLSP